MRLPLRGGELERKLVLGLTRSHLYLSLQCCLGDFFALVKNKDKTLGGWGVWTAFHQGVGTAWAFGSLRHPVSPSYHCKSLLFFQPGFVSPSSHHALPSLTLFLLASAGKEEDLTAVCKAVFATAPCGVG